MDLFINCEEFITSASCHLAVMFVIYTATMQSPKKTIGIVALVAFLLGSGFILVKFGNKSFDNPSSDPTVQPIADVPINQTPVQVPAVVQENTPMTEETSGNSSPASPASKNPVVSSPVAPKPTQSSPYKNGTYVATGSYDSPAGIERVGVSITLQNGIIESATVTNEAQDGTSSRYQNKFISGYKQYVIGKNIADVSLSRVSGSSLTPIGFNQALAKIKTEAAA